MLFCDSYWLYWLYSIFIVLYFIGACLLRSDSCRSLSSHPVGWRTPLPWNKVTPPCRRTINSPVREVPVLTTSWYVRCMISAIRHETEGIQLLKITGGDTPGLPSLGRGIPLDSWLRWSRLTVSYSPWNKRLDKALDSCSIKETFHLIWAILNLWLVKM